jgi:hypothetical protein
MAEEAHREFFAKLDAEGAEKVRMNLASNVYLGGDAALVRAWIERNNERSSSEQLLLARRASADAHKANKIAIAALIVAAISMIVAFWGVAWNMPPQSAPASPAAMHQN